MVIEETPVSNGFILIIDINIINIINFVVVKCEVLTEVNDDTPR